MLSPTPHAMSRDESCVIYLKNLGWNEYDENGDCRPALIAVVYSNYGYNIFRDGAVLIFIEWVLNREEAIEFAVDRARKEVADHEIHQANRN